MYEYIAVHSLLITVDGYWLIYICSMVEENLSNIRVPAVSISYIHVHVQRS